MFVSQALKWIVPLVKPVETIEKQTPVEDSTIPNSVSLNSPMKLSTKADTFSTVSADAATSLLSLNCDSDCGKITEIVSDFGAGDFATNSYIIKSESFIPIQINNSFPDNSHDLKLKRIVTSSFLPSADFMKLSLSNDVPKRKEEFKQTTNNEFGAINHNKYIVSKNSPAAPLISKADTVKAPHMISKVYAKSHNDSSSDAAKWLSVFKNADDERNCNNIVNKNNKKCIYTQTDIKKSKRHLNCYRTQFENDPVDQDMEIEFSRSKTCLTLEKFVAASKTDFRECINSKRIIHDECVYGELLVFGCNGSPPSHLSNQMQSKFILRKRHKANGVKESFSYVTSDETSLQSSRENLTVSYNISPDRSVVVEYVRDKSMDMFQIGRYENLPVDFRVLDVNPSRKSRNGVSRFACRILVERYGEHKARVYAAAFDSTGNIFLGEKALTCVREGKMDGFTTNGVFLMHPDSTCPVWREVSVCGYIYPIRSFDIEPKKRPRLSNESNILQDGTLIDLCGVTLVWRTPLGLKNTPKGECLKKLNNMLQNMAPECKFLKVPQKRTYTQGKKQPYVFLCCGHVIGLNEQLVSAKSMEGWSCPICRTIGSIAKLEVGREPGFFADKEFPSHALRPCGHVTNLKTARYWSSIKVPEHRNIEAAGLCPFCGSKLNTIKKYVELLIPQ